MPLVDAAGYAYRPYPSTDVSPTVPDDYQRIPNATPEAFGAQVGLAKERVGAQLNQVGNELAVQAVARQEIYNKIVSDKGQTRYSEEMNAKMYGDPNTGSVGLMGLHGEDAMKRAREIFGPGGESEQLREQIGQTMPNAKARIDYNEYTRRQSTYLNQTGSAHYMKEMDTYGTASQKARGDVANQTAALNYTNPELVNAQLNEKIDAKIKEYQHVTGSTVLTGPIIELAKSTAVDEFIHAQVMARANAGDLVGARALLQHPETIRPGLKISNPDVASRLKDHINQKAIEQETGQIILKNGGLGATSGSGIVPPAPLAPEVYKPIINQAAAQHGVPEELLTRVLGAESDFSSTARGPTVTLPSGEVVNGMGIAQFTAPTMRDRGIKNPDDPSEAIPAAANYLAELHSKYGSWHGAVNAYLGGEAKNSPRYTQKGVWQLADQLDHPSSVRASIGTGQESLAADFAKSPARPFGTPEEAGRHLTTVAAPGGASFRVHELAAPQIQGFINELESMGYKIDPATSGGYNDRNKVGVNSNEKSEHAFGSAIDINWERNKQADTLITDLPANVGQIAAKWGLKWGGTFEGKKDAMHFEVARLLTGGRPTTIASTAPAAGALATSPGKPTLQFVDGKWVPYMPEGIQ